MERGFLSQKGSERGRGVKEKDLNRNKKITSSGIGMFTDSEDTTNDDSPTGVASVVRKGVTPSVVDMTVEMAKQNSLDDTTVLGSFPPLSTSISTTAGNAPGKSSYANITSKQSGKKVNVRTLFTPGGNRIDVVVSVDSIRAISKRFANTAYGFFLGKKVGYPVVANYKWHPDENLLKEDVSNVLVWVKLYGVLVMAFSEDGLSAISTKLGTPLMLDSYTCDMCMQSWGRSSYARVMVELKADVELKDNIVVYRPVTKKPNAGSSGDKKKGVEPTIKNPLIPTGIVKNDSEVELVFDETTNLRTLMSGKDGNDKGYGTNSLLKQWRDSYPDNDDYDVYDDDMYENHDLFKHLQSICDYLDITESSLSKSKIARHYKSYFYEGRVLRPVFYCNRVDKITVKEDSYIEKLFSKKKGGHVVLGKDGDIRAKWCKWMDVCIRLEIMSILVNRSPMEKFGHESSVNDVTVSHLQYEDDTIFFGEWNKENAKSLMCILKCFEEVSGIRVNYNKRLPIHENMGMVSSWNLVVEKFKSRLADWKAKTMMFRERLTLVKSVLGDGRDIKFWADRDRWKRTLFVWRALNGRLPVGEELA
ncbi:cytokinin dehydrogenase 3-like protein [Tanacetum coccineum]